MIRLRRFDILLNQCRRIFVYIPGGRPTASATPVTIAVQYEGKLMSNKANLASSPLRSAAFVAALSIALSGISTVGATAAPARNQVDYADEFPLHSYGPDQLQGGSCLGRFGAAQMGGFANPSESPYTWDGRCRY